MSDLLKLYSDPSLVLLTLALIALLFMIWEDDK